MTADAAIRVLQPGETHRHFARVGVAVVCTFLAFATEVDAAVRGAHVRDTDAEDILFAKLDSLLRFDDKGRVCAKVVTEELAVKPDSSVRCNLFKTQKNALGHLFFVVNRESLEIESAVLSHQKLVKSPFPDVGNAYGLCFFRICCIPTIGDACVFRVPDHLPVAIKANNFAH